METEPIVSTYVKGFHDEDAVREMTYRPLGRTGLQISQLGFGSSGLSGIFKNTTEEELIEVVREAIKSGINYIDTAPWYGNGKSETILGKAFTNVPRKSFFIATKVCRYEPDVEKMFDFSAQRTKKSVDDSLQRMGLDYVDVLQIHDMEFAPDLDIILKETLPALQEIKDSGKARFIGITGYPLDNFRLVLEKSKVKIDTVLSYCHGCMNDNSMQDIIPYLQSKDVGIINASPIGMGLLCESGPPTWHPARPEIKESCRKAVQYCNQNDVDITKLALKHSLDISGTDTTIVGTDSLDILYNNLKVMKTALTQEEKQIYKDVMEKFLKPLNNMNWEGIEVQQYRENLAALHLTQ